MDAGIILATSPTSLASGADAAPDASGEDAAAFAAHLDSDPPERPAARKSAIAKPERDDEDETPTPPPAYSLSAPTAPVIVRDNGAPAVQEIALTTTPAGAPQPKASPDAAAPTSANGIAGTADAGAVQPARDAAAAASGDAALSAPDVETIAANAATPAKAATPAQSTDTPRAAGKTRNAKADAEASDNVKPASARAQAAASTAQGEAKSGTAGPSAPSSVAAPKTADAAVQPAATGDAAAVTLEARRAAEAPALAVHRPPTVATTVAQHIIRRFDGKSTSIDVRLDPAELGRVSVKLDVGADSRVTAVVAADNPATLSDLMRSARELERALESAGLELVQGGLSFDLSDRRSDNGAASNDASPIGAIADNDNAAAPTESAASRPFGLESWRGVRVDVTV